MKNNRGRQSVKDMLSESLKATDRGMFERLEKHMQGVVSTTQALQRVESILGKPVSRAAFRTMLHSSVKSGRVRKGTVLHNLTRLARGPVPATVAA